MKNEPSLFEFIKKFADEAACIEFLEKARFPNGEIVSPFGSRGASRVGKSRPGVYKCRETRKTFTVRNGTIFEESRLPLHTWFYAIYLMHSQKKGISSVQIAKFCDVTQKTAWFMLHRVRYAVEHRDFMRPLGGIVEIDEHYSGGSTKGGKRGRGAEAKTPIVGMVEREGEIRVQAVENCKSATLMPIIRRNVRVEHTSVVTDDFSVYRRLPKLGYESHTINHSGKEYVRDGVVHTNTIEGFWSHLKAGIRAIQIHVSPKHLNRYCKEYEFRYNHRGISDYARFVELMNNCSGRLTYAALIS